MRDCGWPAAIFSSVFVSQAQGSTPFCLQVPMSEAMRPESTRRRLRHGRETVHSSRSDFTGRMTFSTKFGSISTRPSYEHQQPAPWLAI